MPGLDTASEKQKSVVDGKYPENSAVASVQSAFLARSAHLAGTVQIALLAPTRIKAGRNACRARRVLGAVLSGLVIAQPVKTVLQGNTRRQKVWHSSQAVIHAV